MRPTRLVSLLSVVLIALPVGPLLAQAPQADLEASQVRRSIDRGVAYLRKEQSARGTWRDTVGYSGGVSALCTLALLNAGVPANDPQIHKALARLRDIKPSRTYSVALQTMVFCTAEPKKDRTLILRNVKWLEQAQVNEGSERGAWSYGMRDGGGDASNAQFAVLALHEAERVGITVKQQTWRLAHTYWKDKQLPGGGWGYNPEDQQISGSRTCAGIAGLVITGGKINQADARVVDGRVLCCDRQEQEDGVERGLAWLGKNFRVGSNPGWSGRGPQWFYYYIYGVERVGRLTARRFLGDHDWYREGAKRLLQEQDNLNGSWQGRGHADEHPHIATSMALLFLAKGRRPVVAAKLRYGEPGDWDSHRHDLANLTHYTEKKWERDLTWQIIDGRSATVEDLLETPVLYISGHNAPRFTAKQKRALRDYLDRGGFLFAEACCAGGPFEKGFRQLMQEIFPEKEYGLRLLPPEHPIWRAEERVDPKHLRPLYGIEYGCRTSVVFCPEDLSCYWELSRSGREQTFPAEVQGQIDAALSIGTNVLTYATGREPKYKDLVASNLEPEKRADQDARGTIFVAKLRHGGGCNAAPGALANLLRAAEAELDMNLSSDDRPLAITDPSLLRYHLVFMHGRNDFRLTPAERKALRTYLERGGTLLADAVCASRPFAEAFRREMRLVLPDAPLEQIGAGHPLFTPQFGGYDITRVSRRDPSAAGAEGPLRARVRQVPPELHGAKINDRLAILFSPHDISCALERHESLECQGYIRKDAARIGVNVLMYSLHQ